MLKIYILAAVLVAGFLMYLLSPVLTPFMVALVLAYLFDPTVARLARCGIGRTGGTVVVFVLFTLAVTALFLVLVPMIGEQGRLLIEALPRYLERIQSMIQPWVEANLDIELNFASATQLLREHGQQIGQWAAGSVKSAFDSGSAVMLALANLVLIPVVTFYLLRDWPHLVRWLEGLLPRPMAPKVVEISRESDEMLSSFLRGQLAVMLSLGAFYAIGLTLAGLNTGILVGLLAGLLSFVPYLGVIVGVGMGLIAMYVQTGELMPLVWVLLVFGAGQLLESFVFQPFFVGDRIGLHPVTVIFAVMAGGQLFGFFGLLLALPVSAVLVVLVRHAWAAYTESATYRGESDASTEDAVPQAAEQDRS
ncbi:MAG: AI-2E family transporter [Halothiobacillaceae bacterium]